MSTDNKNSTNQQLDSIQTKSKRLNRRKLTAILLIASPVIMVLLLILATSLLRLFSERSIWTDAIIAFMYVVHTGTLLSIPSFVAGILLLVFKRSK